VSETDQPRPPAVVVGVDGSERNQAAIDWAVTEAVRAKRDLRLVGVADESATMMPRWLGGGGLQYSNQETEALLGRVRRRILPGWDRVAVESVSGAAALQLVGVLEPGDLLVVGRRGVGPVERAVLGSTSIAVAGRSTVPTVIVPDDWEQAAHAERHLVAGVDGTARDTPVLEFAFGRAEALGVTLDVVGAWETPPLYSWASTQSERRSKEAENQLGERLQPWAERFPRVDLMWSAPPTAPSVALLADGRGAQLVVLGRFSGVHHLDGFSGFSTSRRVLHHAECPVAIVPLTAEGGSEPLFDEEDQPEF
jgi:nucleotide-binding universal stress UspA family protein